MRNNALLCPACNHRHHPADDCAPPPRPARCGQVGEWISVADSLAILARDLLIPESAEEGGAGPENARVEEPQEKL